MAFVLSSSLFTRALVIFCIIRGVMAFTDTKNHYSPPEFTFQCSSSYVINTIERRSCELDTSLEKKLSCTNGDENRRLIRFVVPTRLNQSICLYTYKQLTDPCKNTTNDGDIKCEDMGTKRKFTCFFNATEQFKRQIMFCGYLCEMEKDKKPYKRFLVTNSTCPLQAPPTTAAPTTAAPTTAAPPEKEFPIWAAVVIALGIGGLIALLLFLVWRKRRQAQGPVQDPEGGNTGNPEGEEAEGGEDDAEEEDATNTESAEKSEDAEGGEYAATEEEAPEEE